MEISLFAYGTLQRAEIQKALFGRILKGRRDQLGGFIIRELVFISENEGQARQVYPAAVATGIPEDVISGTVYRLNQTELQIADEYETEAYHRIQVKLDSGGFAWVYIASS